MITMPRGVADKRLADIGIVIVGHHTRQSWMRGPTAVEPSGTPAVSRIARGTILPDYRAEQF